MFEMSRTKDRVIKSPCTQKYEDKQTVSKPQVQKNTYLIRSLVQPAVNVGLPSKIFVIGKNHTTSTDCGRRCYSKVFYLE